jgi:hypothetical protein
LRKLFPEYSPEKCKKCCEHVRKIEDKYCEEDGLVTHLNVNRRRTMIGEAGGKEGRAYSQGKHLKALHFKRSTPIAEVFCAFR